MANGAPMVIPTKGTNFAQGLFQSFTAFSEKVSNNFQKSEEEKQKAANDYKKWQAENRDLFEQLVASQDNPTIKKLNDKLIKTYYKVFVSNKFFKKLGKALKDIAKKISNAASSLFMKILKFILIMAILDPSGKLFESLLDIAVNILTMLLNMIAKFLPKILRTMIKLITETIPDILKRVMPKILEAFSGMFLTLGKDFAKTNPMLGKLFTQVGEMLQNPKLIKFMSDLMGLFPLVIGLMGLLTLLAKIGPMLKLVGPWLLKFGMAFLKVVFSAIAIQIMAALALVGVILYVWFRLFTKTTFDEMLVLFKKWWDEGILVFFYNFFAEIGKGFVEMWNNLVFLYKFYNTLVIKTVIKLVVNIIKFFVKWYKKAVRFATRVFTRLFLAFYKIKEKFIDPILAFASSIGGLVGSLPKKLSDFGLSKLQAVKDTLSNIAKVLKEKVVGAIYTMKDVFAKLILFIQSIFSLQNLRDIALGRTGVVQKRIEKTVGAEYLVYMQEKAGKEFTADKRKEKVESYKKLNESNMKQTTTNFENALRYKRFKTGKSYSFKVAGGK